MLQFKDIKNSYPSLSAYFRRKEKEKPNLDIYLDRLTEDVPDEKDREILIQAYDSLSNTEKNARSTHYVAKLWKAYRNIAAPKKTTTSNEKDIRDLVTKFLGKVHKGYTIRHEFSSWQLPVRPDVMAIGENDKNPIITVEIKSDKDSFDRIYRQLSEYSKFSTTVYLALDEKHLVPFLNKYGTMFSNIGILVYVDEKLEVYKKPYIDPFGLGSLFHIMWFNELKLMIAPFKGRSKMPNKDSFGMEAVIAAIYTHREVREIAKAIVLWRLRNHDNGDRLIYHDIKIEDFCIDMERKQKLFTVLLNRDVWDHRNLNFKKFNEASREALLV